MAQAGVELGLLNKTKSEKHFLRLSLLHIMLSWLLNARFIGLGVIFIRGSGRILERFGLEFEP